eukprot:5690445-Pyramimonas_sp.AAC.1
MAIVSLGNSWNIPTPPALHLAAMAPAWPRGPRIFQEGERPAVHARWIRGPVSRDPHKVVWGNVQRSSFFKLPAGCMPGGAVESQAPL